MNPAGTAIRPSFFNFKTPVAALIAALMLSACVETAQQPGSTEPPAEALVQQPEIVTDAGIYAARSDGQFTVPALPVDQIPASHRRQVVDYQTDQPAGTIIIDPSTKLLYYVMGKGKALRYGISVGAEGFQWSGEAIVSRKGQWPKWYPPKEMIARKPSLEKWKDGQPGGPTNPLGSRAIYLTSNGVDYGYRIHGTPEWKTIGRNASSGCFRMIQQDVMDLYERVQGGEKVIVLTAKGEMPSGLSIPKPPAPKKAVAKTTPKPEAAAEAATPTAATPELSLAPPPAALGGEAPAADSATPDAAPALSLPTVAPAIAAPTLTVPEADAPAAATPAVTPAVPAAPAAVTPAAPAAATPAAPAALPAVPSTTASPICAVPLVDGKCPG